MTNPYKIAAAVLGVAVVVAVALGLALGKPVTFAGADIDRDTVVMATPTPPVQGAVAPIDPAAASHTETATFALG
jgi:hypothetical protein